MQGAQNRVQSGSEHFIFTVLKFVFLLARCSFSHWCVKYISLYITDSCPAASVIKAHYSAVKKLFVCKNGALYIILNFSYNSI
jgi:hypothetical protein